MDDHVLNSLLRETKKVADQGNPESADVVLEKLQAAVREHSKILHQQELLIRKLRDQLREVNP